MGFCSKCDGENVSRGILGSDRCFRKDHSGCLLPTDCGEGAVEAAGGQAGGPIYWEYSSYPSER